MLLLILFAINQAGFVRTAPISLTQPTGESEPRYYSPPRRRGTIDILLSSVITLTLCVYTAIHLNITPERKIWGIPSVWVYKVYWVLIALVAPEFVLYAAYLQWQNARILCNELKKLDPVDEKDEAVPLGNVSLIARAMSWIRGRSRRSTTQTAPSSVPINTSESKEPEHLVVAKTLSEAEEHEDHHPDSTARFDQPDNAGGAGPAPSQNHTGLNAGVLDSSPAKSVHFDSRESSSAQATRTDPSPTDAESQPEKAKWSQITMMSAFYIVMGGFAYDVSDTILGSSDYNYRALTPRGFLKFAQAGLLTPELLNNKDIADRSKADSLGKLLVCVQALWMVINCIARKAQGLPNTLVELNVIVHVVVAVVVYGLWWQKPLAVSQPTFLSRRRAGDNHPDNAVYADRFAFNTTCQTLDITRSPFNNHTLAKGNHEPIRVPSTVVTPDSLGVQIWGEPQFDERWTQKSAQKHVDQLKITTPGILLLCGQILEMYNPPATVRLSYKSVWFTKKTLDKLSEDLVRYETPVELNDDQTKILGKVPSLYPFTTKDPRNYTVKGSVYTGRVGRSRDDVEFPLMLLAWFLSAIYAGAHASAWSSHFPSYIERWIWRGSCISIASAIPVLWSVFTGSEFVHRKLPPGSHRRKLFGLWRPFAFALLVSFLVLYVSARCFILVESFISMRSLPVGAYDTIQWTEFWPHA